MGHDRPSKETAAECSGAAVPALTYDAPALVEIGPVHEITLGGCFWDKKWGGTDGLEFMGMNVPVSSC
jgi:hypothetical protein